MPRMASLPWNESFCYICYKKYEEKDPTRVCPSCREKIQEHIPPAPSTRDKVYGVPQRLIPHALWSMRIHPPIITPTLYGEGVVFYYHNRMWSPQNNLQDAEFALTECGKVSIAQYGINGEISSASVTEKLFFWKRNIQALCYMPSCNAG